MRFDQDAATEQLEAAAAARGVPLAVVNVNNQEARNLYERRLVLVRPDGHSAWRGDEQSADAMTVIDTVRGSA